MRGTGSRLSRGSGCGGLLSEPTVGMGLESVSGTLAHRGGCP